MDLKTQRRLPLGSDTRTKPCEQALVTSWPLKDACRLQSIVIANARDWIVNDILIGGKSQLDETKDLAGAFFTVDPNTGTRRVSVAFHNFDVITAESGLALLVTYLGSNPRGEPFFANALVEPITRTIVEPSKHLEIM